MQILLQGIRNLASNNIKFNFYKTIQKIEKDLHDSTVSLHSFIISITPYDELLYTESNSKEEMIEKNIIFQEDKDYINTMFLNINNRQ